MFFTRALLFLTLLITYAFSVAEGEDLCVAARHLLRSVSEIRGLAAGETFACRVENKAQVTQFLRTSVEERLQHDKAEYEQYIFEMLGVIPPQERYVEGLVALYTSQLGGYYDPKTKTVVMADWMPEPLQRLIAAHELTHLLQDRQFTLEPIVGVQISESDMALARAALVEGDATLSAEEFERRDDYFKKHRALHTPESEPSLVVPMSTTLMDLVHFPYTEGVVFAKYLFAKGGYSAINAALRDPPNSTREILHPEVYEKRLRKGDKEVDLKLPHPPGARYTDVLGEYFIRVLFKSILRSEKTRAEVAQELVNDSVYVEQPSGSPLRVVWCSQWSSKEAAEIFANYLRIHLQQTRNLKLLANTMNHIVVEGGMVTAFLSREVQEDRRK